MFWQYGDTLSTGQTSDDGNTIFYGTSDYTVLVTDHVEAIDGGTGTTGTTTTTATGTTSSATSTATSTSTGTIPKYGQCGGLNWSGGSCVAGTTCTYSNAYYSQCL